MEYSRRLVDLTLDRLLPSLPAIALEGAKGVGKTATASQRCDDVFSLDKGATRTLIALDPEIILASQGTTFIDEWQLVPEVWDVVRHAVDDGAAPGRFVLAGSAGPQPGTRIHSGAGRIVRVMMRPMSLPERGLETPTVSLSELLSGSHPDIDGRTGMVTADYAEEIVASGFPGIRRVDASVRGDLLDSYIDRIVDHDIDEAGSNIRRPAALREWLAAYGAATGTTASYSSILRAATPGQEDKPAKQTAMTYRDLLQRMWILDPLPAWVPGSTPLMRLAQSPKHHLVDPALAARLAGATFSSLIRGEGPAHHDNTFLGALFESLGAQTVRSLAQVAGAKTYHMRVQGGEHEIDIIVERPDRKILAIETKLSPMVRPADVAHVNWLETQIPDLLLDRIILNTGDRAYRRKDGVAVIPLSLLGL